MQRLDVIDFVLLAALWGGSFLFIRIAAPAFGPWALMLLRCGIGAITLLTILAVLGKPYVRNPHTLVDAVTGVVNSAIPFVLLAYAALYITTGTLSILNAVAPFWGAVIGYVWLHERLTRFQIIGLALGFIGVCIIVMSDSTAASGTRQSVLLGIAAAIAATFAYGFAANFAKKFLVGSDPLLTATNSQIGATLVLAIPGVIFWPETVPGISAWVSLVLLGVFCTGVAYVLFFRLVKNVGPVKTVTVTFLIPVFGMFFGWLFLQERVSMMMLAGALFVVLGCSLTVKLIKPK